MNKRTAILSLVTALSVGVSGCYEKPSVGCPVQRVSFAAKYTKVSGDCTLTGETLGMNRYNNPEDVNAKQYVAIRPASLVPAEQLFDEYVSTGTAGPKSVAVGTLATEPDANNICAATEFVPAVQTVGGDTTKYEFSDVKIYVTPTIPGSHFTATLNYSKTGAGACSGVYTVDAVFPVVACANKDPANTNPSTGDARCAPTAPDANGVEQPNRFINPELDLVCQDILVTNSTFTAVAPGKRCVPAKPFPSLR